MQKRQSVKDKLFKLDKIVERKSEEFGYRFDMLFGKLEKLNPDLILKLGYGAIKKQNEYISSVNNLNIGDNIDVVLKDGVVRANVISKGEI